MTGPLATYDALIVELRAKAGNAARRNKPTMWAYNLEAIDGLEATVGRDRTDGGVIRAARTLSAQARLHCPALPPTEAARLWALGIYSRRILERAGQAPGPRPSLAWLKERAA